MKRQTVGLGLGVGLLATALPHAAQQPRVTVGGPVCPRMEASIGAGLKALPRKTLAGTSWGTTAGVDLAAGGDGIRAPGRLDGDASWAFLMLNAVF